MGKLKYFFVILASAAVVILFQNCGDIRIGLESESLGPERLSCVDPSGSSPTVVVSSLSEADQSNLNAHVLETRFSDNQTLTSTRTFEWSFDENPQPAGANLSVNVAQLVACSTHKVTAKWIDSCSQPQELTQIYTQYGEGCSPPPEPVPEPTPTPEPTPEPVSLCGTAANSLKVDGVDTILSNTALKIDIAVHIGLNDRLLMSKGQSRSIEFKTGAVGTGYQFGFDYMTAGQLVPMFVNISKTPCDFSYAQIDSPVLSGFNSRSCTGAVRFVVQNPGATPIFGKCSLLPNTTYYLNLRNEDPTPLSLAKPGQYKRGIDSCGYPLCGFLMTIYQDNL